MKISVRHQQYIYLSGLRLRHLLSTSWEEPEGAVEGWVSEISRAQSSSLRILSSRHIPIPSQSELEAHLDNKSLWASIVRSFFVSQLLG